MNIYQQNERLFRVSENIRVELSIHGKAGIISFTGFITGGYIWKAPSSFEKHTVKDSRGLCWLLFSRTKSTCWQSHGSAWSSCTSQTILLWSKVEWGDALHMKHILRRTILPICSVPTYSHSKCENEIFQNEAVRKGIKGIVVTTTTTHPGVFGGHLPGRERRIQEEFR